MSKELELLAKLNKALGEDKKGIKSQSVLLLEKIANEISAIKANNQVDKEERQKLIELYEELGDKIQMLASPKVIVPKSFKIENPVKEVTIKNPVKEVVVSDKGWVQKLLAGNSVISKSLEAIKSGIKAVTDISKYEGNNRNVRVVLTDLKGEEQDLAEVLKRLVVIINSIPKGSGGGSSSGCSAIDISTLAKEATLQLVEAHVGDIFLSTQDIATSVIGTETDINTLVNDYTVQQSTTPANASTGKARATQISGVGDSGGAIVPHLTDTGEIYAVGTGGASLALSSDITNLSTTLMGVRVAGASVTASVASSATAVTIQAANGSRKGLTIVNDSTQILYIKYDSTVTTSLYTFKLFPQMTFIMDEPFYTGVVSGIWASANGAAKVTELS